MNRHSQDNIPTGFQELLAKLFYDQTYIECDLSQRSTINASIPAIEDYYDGLLPDKLPERAPYRLIHIGFNQAIETIKRNFKGQPKENK